MITRRKTQAPVYLYLDSIPVVIMLLSGKHWLYRQTTNISLTKSQYINVSHLVWKLSLPNPFEPVVKSKNEDVVGAVPIGDAPATSEWPAIWLLT